MKIIEAKDRVFVGEFRDYERVEISKTVYTSEVTLAGHFCSAILNNPHSSDMPVEQVVEKAYRAAELLLTEGKRRGHCYPSELALSALSLQSKEED